MKVRESFELFETLIGKRKAASIYAEDYVKLLNLAVDDKCSFYYREFEKTQRLSDMLQNLKRRVFIDIDESTSYPYNITNLDGTAYLAFKESLPMSILGSSFMPNIPEGLNTTLAGSEYRRKSTNDYSVLENTEFYIEPISSWIAPVLDQLELKDIEDGIIIKISSKITIRDYRYGGNTNNLLYGFKLNNAGVSVYIEPDSILDSVPKFLSFRYNSRTKMFELLDVAGSANLGNGSVIVKMPENYWHLTGLNNRLDYKKSIACETPLHLEIPVKRLTDQVRSSFKANTYLRPSIKRRNNYFNEINNTNSVYPDLEVLYCDSNENNLVLLKRMEVFYLKTPKRYVLKDDDISGADTTEELEFQEDVCSKIVEQVVNIFLEKTGNPRVKSFAVVNSPDDLAKEQ